MSELQREEKVRVNKLIDDFLQEIYKKNEVFQRVLYPESLPEEKQAIKQAILDKVKLIAQLNELVKEIRTRIKDEKEWVNSLLLELDEGVYDLPGVSAIIRTKRVADIKYSERGGWKNQVRMSILDDDFQENLKEIKGEIYKKCTEF